MVGILSDGMDTNLYRVGPNLIITGDQELWIYFDIDQHKEAYARGEISLEQLELRVEVWLRRHT